MMRNRSSLVIRSKMFLVGESQILEIFKFFIVL